jgi:hypothetical protein
MVRTAFRVSGKHVKKAGKNINDNSNYAMAA